jgi:hypothetical protein
MASLSINPMLPLFPGPLSAAKSFFPSIASVTLRLLRVYCSHIPNPRQEFNTSATPIDGQTL